MVSGVEVIPPCNELTIRNIGSPFAAIQAQGDFYLWTAQPLNTVGEQQALAQAIANADRNGSFNGIVKNFHYFSGTDVTLDAQTFGNKLADPPSSSKIVRLPLSILPTPIPGLICWWAALTATMMWIPSSTARAMYPMKSCII